MVRVSAGYTRSRRHKRFVKQAKGFRLWRNNVYKQVRLALIKQGQNAYRGRKLKKRDFRRLWIERLNASLRTRWSKYSVFMWQARSKNIQLDRKVMSNIAVVFPKVFDEIYATVTN